MTAPSTDAPPAPNAPPDFAAIADEIERDLDGERYRAAIARAQHLDLDACPAEPWEQLMPIVLRCRSYGGAPADKIVLEARALLDRARPGRARAHLRAEIAYALISKRVPVLAAAEATAVVDEWPEGSLGAGVRGWLAMQFDRRDDARAAYEAATTLVGPARGWLGLARVAYIEGRFDDALAALGSIGVAPRYQVSRLRLTADIARVRGDWTTVLATIDEILAASSAPARCARWIDATTASRSTGSCGAPATTTARAGSRARCSTTSSAARSARA
jgi:hypothetical protein